MTIKTVFQTTEQYGTSTERSSMRTSDIADGHRIVFRETDTGDVYEYFGTGWEQVVTNGAAHTSLRAGTGKQQYRYSFAASTRETINFPPGADITEITVMASLNAAPASMQAVAHIKGLLCIDAVSEVDAGNVLSGTTYPDSNTLTQRFDVIPLNVPITIPLSAKLANGTNSTGRIDVRTSDTTIALDWFILGN